MRKIKFKEEDIDIQYESSEFIEGCYDCTSISFIEYIAKNFNKNGILNGTIIIALATLMGYIVAYIKEAIYLIDIGISIENVTLKLENVVLTSIILLFVLSIVLLTILTLNKKKDITDQELFKRYKRTNKAIIMALICQFTYIFLSISFFYLNVSAMAIFIPYVLITIWGIYLQEKLNFTNRKKMVALVFTLIMLSITIGFLYGQIAKLRKYEIIVEENQTKIVLYENNKGVWVAPIVDYIAVIPVYSFYNFTEDTKVITLNVNFYISKKDELLYEIIDEIYSHENYYSKLNYYELRRSVLYELHGDNILSYCFSLDFFNSKAKMIERLIENAKLVESLDSSTGSEAQDE